jgi:hypothetical protein
LGYNDPVTDRWITIVETPGYLREAEKALTQDERKGIIETLARDPKCGDVVPGGGGIRKVRFAAKGKGKSGGVRVIYYYHSLLMPLYLLTLFGKGERANLSRAEINSLSVVAKQLARTKGEGQ